MPLAPVRDKRKGRDLEREKLNALLNKDQYCTLARTISRQKRKHRGKQSKTKEKKRKQEIMASKTHTAETYPLAREIKG